MNGLCMAYLGFIKSNQILFIYAETLYKINHYYKGYSETLNNEYIERIHQISNSLLYDNEMLQIFSFMIK